MATDVAGREGVKSSLQQVFGLLNARLDADFVIAARRPGHGGAANDPFACLDRKTSGTRYDARQSPCWRTKGSPSLNAWRKRRRCQCGIAALPKRNSRAGRPDGRTRAISCDGSARRSL